jgi:hypothetical protein
VNIAFAGTVVSAAVLAYLFLAPIPRAFASFATFALLVTIITLPICIVVLLGPRSRTLACLQAALVASAAYWTATDPHNHIAVRIGVPLIYVLLVAVWLRKGLRVRKALTKRKERPAPYARRL